MKHQVNSKLLILFGIVCGIFFSVNSVLAADTITNKSSTFGTKMTKQQISSSGDTDSALAEKIRTQRAAIDARENREANESQTKSGAKSNSCDNDLRKCIESQCGASYKKCETDTDTTFSDKLNACRKKTNCTAHEFAMFVPEIKEDKKQEIRLAEYNKVLDCGNSYNNCIITECGIRFNKCLSKSAGDKAIAKCKSIATDCTEADSGLTSRIGSVFGTVRQTAEKQVKADEKKLYELRDKMRKSCESLGAMFDERSFDCVFSVSFSSGSDDKTFNASKKLYAGSLFDCTPDWFGIDVTTFKENAYRLTRAQTAASSAMLGSGLGTAAGALASGAIDRAIQTKKAKDALEEECEKAGKTVKDGKCVDMTDEEACKASGGKWKNDNCKCDADKYDTVDNKCVKKDSSNETTDTEKPDEENTNSKDEPKDENPDRQPCTDAQRNANLNELIYAHETEFKDGKCVPVNCKSGYTLEGTTCVETEEDEIIYCKSEEAKKLNAKVATKDKDGKCVPTACIDNTYELSGGKCIKKKSESATPTPAPGPAKHEDQSASKGIDDAIEKEHQKQMAACTDSGGEWNDKKSKPCSCSSKKGLTDDLKGFTCKCKTNGYKYTKQSNKCVDTKQQTTDTAKKTCEDSGGTFIEYGKRCSCNSEKSLFITEDKTKCDCYYPDKQYFDQTDKRCYFTAEALKNCDQYKAKGDKAKGCICPTEQYEGKNWNEVIPRNYCL